MQSRTFAPVYVRSRRKERPIARASILPLTARGTLLRTIGLGGTLIFIIQFIHQWIVATLIQGNPFTLVWQYI